MTLVTEAIRRLVEHSDATSIHHESIYSGDRMALWSDVELVTAWLDGSATAGVAMTGADLEGILECVEYANAALDEIDGVSRDVRLTLSVRSTWRIRAERIRRAVHWANPLLGEPAELSSGCDDPTCVLASGHEPPHKTSAEAWPAIHADDRRSV